MPITKLDDITIADVKSYFNYTDTNRDTQLTNILPMTRDLIKGYCNNDFESKTRTAEKPYILPERLEFYLKYRPVVSITSLTEGGTALVQDTDYYCELDTGRVEKLQATNTTTIYDVNRYWSTVRNTVVVTYTAGQVPTYDVVLAFYEVAGIYTEINQKVFTDIEGTEHATAYDKIPQEIKDILNRYKISEYHV